MTKNWPQVTDGEGWLRNMEKTMIRQERRSQVTEASDLMGPGLGPFAVQVLDWNAEETFFNGFFYSAPGAINSPNGLLWWMGQVIATPDGHGIQQVWNFRDGSLPMAKYIRNFTSPTEGLRIFSAWTVT
jgi:hypothetical protein